MIIFRWNLVEAFAQKLMADEYLSYSDRFEVFKDLHKTNVTPPALIYQPDE